MHKLSATTNMRPNIPLRLSTRHQSSITTPSTATTTTTTTTTSTINKSFTDCDNEYQQENNQVSANRNKRSRKPSMLSNTVQLIDQRNSVRASKSLIDNSINTNELIQSIDCLPTTNHHVHNDKIHDKPVTRRRISRNHDDVAALSRIHNNISDNIIQVNRITRNHHHNTTTTTTMSHTQIIQPITNKHESPVKQSKRHAVQTLSTTTAATTTNKRSKSIDNNIASEPIIVNESASDELTDHVCERMYGSTNTTNTTRYDELLTDTQHIQTSLSGYWYQLPLSKQFNNNMDNMCHSNIGCNERLMTAKQLCNKLQIKINHMIHKYNTVLYNELQYFIDTCYNHTVQPNDSSDHSNSENKLHICSIPVGLLVTGSNITDQQLLIDQTDAYLSHTYQSNQCIIVRINGLHIKNFESLLRFVLNMLIRQTNKYRTQYSDVNRKQNILHEFIEFYTHLKQHTTNHTTIKFIIIIDNFSHIHDYTPINQLLQYLSQHPYMSQCSWIYLFPVSLLDNSIYTKFTSVLQSQLHIQCFNYQSNHELIHELIHITIQKLSTIKIVLSYDVLQFIFNYYKNNYYSLNQLQSLLNFIIQHHMSRTSCSDLITLNGDVLKSRITQYKAQLIKLDSVKKFKPGVNDLYDYIVSIQNIQLYYSYCINFIQLIHHSPQSTESILLMLYNTRRDTTSQWQTYTAPITGMKSKQLCELINKLLHQLQYKPVYTEYFHDEIDELNNLLQQISHPNVSLPSTQPINTQSDHHNLSHAKLSRDQLIKRDATITLDTHTQYNKQLAKFIYKFINKHLPILTELPCFELYYYNAIDLVHTAYNTNLQYYTQNSLIQNQLLYTNKLSDMYVIKNELLPSIAIDLNKHGLEYSSIMYYMIAEYNNYINLYDFFINFVATVQMIPYDELHEQQQRQYQAIFLTQLYNMCYVGYIRPTKRKQDHVQRIITSKLLHNQ